MTCHCNSKDSFETCCQPIIKTQLLAKTAQQLMRSRYSAYVVADIDYLLKSHYSKTRPTKDRKAILNWTKSVRWVRLEIISTEDGLATDSRGMVEFKAFYIEDGVLQSIHERSIFVKENNLWFYKSGEHY